MTAATDGACGEAGPRGARVRSDAFVRFEAREEGGVAIELTSKVALYYGDSIRQQAAEVLEQLGVAHGELVIEDQGALPFALAARIEAAVKRAGCGEGRAAGLEARPLPPASARDRLRRSRLYLPGNQPKLFVNAALHGPDGVILDLEDSVHPDEKDAARLLVRNALRALDFAGCERMVRINQLPLGLADLDAIVPEHPELILVPKVESAAQVREVERRIDEIEAREQSNRPLWLMPIIESALGVEHAFAIATSCARVAALTIGLEDLTADLGVVKTRQGDESLYARSRLVNAARAAAIQAIDSVYGDVDDAEGLGAWGLRSRALGFEGMGCIHPRQIPVIHRAFAPGRREVAKAKRIVAAFEDAKQRGLGVVSLGSKMIDPPVVNRALKLVAQARAMGLVDDDHEGA